jgi:hypothetical protein
MIQIHLQPEMEAQLVAEAQARGLALDHYLAEIVGARPSARQTEEEQRHEAVEAMMAFSRKHKVTLRGLNLKSMVHEGHKY